MLLQIIIATLFVSMVSLVGLFFSYKRIKKSLHYFVSFSAAALLSVSFFDLIPGALEEIESKGIHIGESLIFVLIGILLFFLIERFIHWHHCDDDHCHEDHSHEKPAGALILIGDFVHNFMDGILIAGAFLLDFATGVATTITVMIHEIPQEFGDFTVLIHSGYSKFKALKFNFLSALSAVLGGLVGYTLFDLAKNIIPYVVLITAGGFLYVALSDIVPSMHKHDKENNVLIIETIIFVATIVVFYFILGFMHSH